MVKNTEMYSPAILESRNLKSVSLGQHEGASKAALPPEALGEKSVLCLFQLLMAARILWCMLHHASPYCIVTSPPTVALLTPSYKDLCDYIGPTQIIPPSVGPSPQYF